MNKAKIDRTITNGKQHASLAETISATIAKRLETRREERFAEQWHGAYEVFENSWTYRRP